jgi:hypothetical protein
LEPDPLDTHPITCWGMPTAEESAERARRECEAIPNYELLYVLNEWIWRTAWAEAKAERPDLVKIIEANRCC